MTYLSSYVYAYPAYMNNIHIVVTYLSTKRSTNITKSLWLWDNYQSKDVIWEMEV